MTTDEYRRSERRFQRWAGYLLVSAVPLPVLLYRVHAKPRTILSAALVPAFMLGVIAPVVFRRRHHPDRHLKSERRFTSLALVCRSLAFVLGVTALIALAISLLAVTALTHKRWLYWLALIPTAGGLVMGLAGLFGWPLHPGLFVRLLS